MNSERRTFLKVLMAASLSGLRFDALQGSDSVQNYKRGIKKESLPADFYEFPRFGNVSLIHITDVHAQLLPTYLKEPDSVFALPYQHKVPPHISGQELLKYYGLFDNLADKYRLTGSDFQTLARQYGRMGGYAYIKSLIDRIRAQRPGALLLDGGDNWQGSATALWTQGQDMVDANLRLGVDVVTGHWEFTYGADRLTKIINEDYKGKIDFVAQNIVDRGFEDPVFQPYVMRVINSIPTAIIGQAFPYTPIANPGHMIPDWSFGIKEKALQFQINEARKKGAQVVVLLSHNGINIDLKLAKRVQGLDAILGGHTHSALPRPVVVSNRGGRTLVLNSGVAGKHISLLDFSVRAGKVRDYRYRLIPVFSNFIKPDAGMSAYINNVRKKYLSRLNEKLTVTETLLYRRGVFNSTFDQIILDALLKTFNADVTLSPGFRFGTSVLAGEPVYYEDIMNQMAITYPIAVTNYLTGKQLRNLLEHIADNAFNRDPYKQQGGDMVRVGNLSYTIKPTATFKHRISEMLIRGKPVSEGKKYKVVGWGDVTRAYEGQAIWDVVANYLRSKKSIRIDQLNIPKVKFK